MAVISVNNFFAQSPYLNLLAAGSDGTDGSAPGIHLRWHLLGDIGENHMPKGNLASDQANYPAYYTNVGYNKPNDHVKIYRTEYIDQYPTEVYFKNQLISKNQLIEAGSKRKWLFSNLFPIAGLPQEKCNLTITFSNKQKYDSVRSKLNPLTDPEEFLKRYDDVLEAETDNDIFFSAEIISGNERLTSGKKIESYDLKFNGTSQYATLPLKNFAYGNDFTIEVNLILAIGENGGVIMSQIASATQEGFSLKTNRNSLSVAFGNTIYQQNYNTSLLDDTYHHIAVTREAQTLKIYVDGIQQGIDITISSTTSGVDTNIILGKNQITYFVWDDFKGILKNFRLWNVAKSDADLMINRFGDISSDFTGLLCWYKLEEGTGQILTDTKANISPIISPIDNSTQLGSFLGSTIGIDVNDPVWKLNPNPFLGITKIETIVKEENLPDSKYLIDCRKTFTNRYDNVLLKEDTSYLLLEDQTFILLENGSPSRIINKVVGENIQKVRFRTYGSTIKGIRIETYKHFLLGTNTQQSGSGGWETINNFSLTLDDSIAFQSLEKPGEYDIHNRWPKYNGGAKVNIANYKDRWYNSSETSPGLKKGVQYYLENSISADNLRAETEITLPVKDIGHNVITEWEIGKRAESQDFIVLDLLNMVSTDFHVARMLGLGHIDILAGKPKSKSKKYIYIALYDTICINDFLSKSYSHSYMTLGVSKSMQGIPDRPTIELEYGMSALNANDEKVLITDKNGYYSGIDLRAINIKLSEPALTEVSGLSDFFTPDIDFCNCEHVEPILYGIEYKNTGDIEWQTPEISHDQFYKDVNNIYETSPVICNDESILYTHLEIQEGSHDYAAYAINWFSRPSTLGNKVTADTVFPKIYTLLPPLNLSAQIIQKEDRDSLLLTSLTEQDKLEAITDPNEVLVRVLFNWDNIQNSNYWHSDKVKFVFRESRPKTISGQVKSSILSSININGELIKVIEVRTQSFSRNSESITQIISPNIDFANNMHLPFINGAFALDGESYIIRDIIPSTLSNEGPIFRLQPVIDRQKASEDLAGTYNMKATEKINLPVPKNNFTVFENLSSTSNWSRTLTFEVPIKTWSNYTETFIEKGSGKEKEIKIGGITGSVTITEKPEVIKVLNGSDILTGKDRTGVYEIVFPNNPLVSDPIVEWYGGSIRVSVDSNAIDKLTGNIRRLDVISIDIVNGKLVLTAADRLFSVDGEKQSPNYQPIPTGNNIFVNFHPGYRIYLTKETGFDKTTLFNFPPKSDFCDTYLSAYAVKNSSTLQSYVGTPTVLRAIKIYEPIQPDPPLGPLYATKPNFFGKATYTFSNRFNNENNRKPFAVIFYRGNDRAILEILYKPQTLNQILLSLESDLFKVNKLQELVNLDVNANGTFKISGGTALPNPDNDKYIVPYADPAVRIYPFKSSQYINGIIPAPGSETTVVSNTASYPYKSLQDWQMNNIVKEAIFNTFLSLTEAPVIYERIKSASDGYQARNIKPVIRDMNGKILPDTDPLYDPAPMAVVIDPLQNIVRFSDFSLDGSSNRMFFYCSREINNNFVMSLSSGVLGPVKLINTAPASAPKIRKIISQYEDPVLNQEPAVLFELNNYTSGERISKFKIYRSTNEVDASNVRMMKLAATFSATEEISDFFEDLDYVPFGEALYYRLVAIREVEMPYQSPNEFPELIESLPSDLAVTNVIDVINPLAPEITPTIGNSTPLILQDIDLTWNRTTYNGTYYLYKMTLNGNWSKIYTIKSNDEVISYNISSLPRSDDNGQTIYHRFKVSVENSSGLFNISDKELTI